MVTHRYIKKKKNNNNNTILVLPSLYSFPCFLFWSCLVSLDALYEPKPAAPVAYQVILEPGIGQFREFESPRVHTRINSWGVFYLRTN